MSHQPLQQPTQPKIFKPTLKAVLSFPRRLCNPPKPAVQKARSFGVIPVYKIQLDDVLNRKHLPPLGLKDFEEWLIFVEQAPENLYFILWLKDYTSQYNQWARYHAKSSRTPNSDTHLHPHQQRTQRFAWPTQTSSYLAMFYARAKQTFFTPNADYELDIPSDILAPFHASNPNTPHPDPEVFAEVASEVERMLNDTLDRFVAAACSNGGTNRAICGIVGGTFLALLGGLPPIICDFALAGVRWWRLAALPLTWMGLTVVVASLNGVCMMIYVFGDLRQLRKFELTRPPISRPQPLTDSPRQKIISSPISDPTPLNCAPAITHADVPPSTPPAPALMRSASSRTTSTYSSHTTASVMTSSSASVYACPIHISPAYYDGEPDPDEPAIESDHVFPHQTGNAFFTSTTASFIHPYDPRTDGDETNNEKNLSTGSLPAPPGTHSPSTSFNFDALPTRPRTFASKHYRNGLVAGDQASMQPHTSQTSDTVNTKLNPRALLARAQYVCNLTKWSAKATSKDPENGGTLTFQSPSNRNLQSHILSHTHPAPHSPHTQVHAIDARLKLAKAVPALSSPLTRVLSPVITRAQWEIVVRSMIFALLISSVLVGALLIIPVAR